MNVSLSYYTSAGGREENEDSVYINEFGKAITAIVADGLGCHENGKQASELAVKVISSELIGVDRVTADKVKEALYKANKEILAKQNGGNMCSTAAVLYADNDTAVAAHVGDSRVYQFRGGKIVYQSSDHSVSQMAVNVGEITPDEIRGHADRNKLLRVLGNPDKYEPELREIEVRKGDAFLLCSDGFWELILETEMQKCLEGSSDAGEWLRSMRRVVDGRMTPKSDNNTAAAIIIGGSNE